MVGFDCGVSCGAFSEASGSLSLTKMCLAKIGYFDYTVS
jgi:hypothetical protein